MGGAERGVHGTAADPSIVPYRRAIVPIGVMFSLSLVCGNLAYLTLSVSFIQMLKVRLTSWPASADPRRDPVR